MLRWNCSAFFFLPNTPLPAFLRLGDEGGDVAGLDEHRIECRQERSTVVVETSDLRVQSRAFLGELVAAHPREDACVGDGTTELP
ncbi:hypothetical protein GS575_27980 [Rhodococcus hoagii]|nr:hypothetical protein [Prescottella equi]